VQGSRKRREAAAPRSDAADEAAPPSTLARRSVGEVVADHIRQLVFSGDLQDGDRVPQRQIAEALGVSSVPVREALVALQREGVVTIEPNRGAFVNGLDADVVTEQFTIFGRIYGLAIRRATERADPPSIEELASLAKRIRSESDLAKNLHVSLLFQHRIVELGGSRRLPALMRPLWHIVPGNFYRSIPGSLERTRRGVAKIVAAMRAGDAERAEAAAWSMMDDIGALLARQLRERDAR
jgi:DNA-binding GntR family transcriptional regulator